MTEPLIQVQSLSRFFVRHVSPKDVPVWKKLFTKPLREEFLAISDLSFDIRTGEKVAFIGPNGAGKSTTLRMLCGLLRPTSGQASVCGLIPWEKPYELAKQIGLVFGQKSQLWPAIPVIDSFDLLAKIYQLDTATYKQQRDKLVSLFGLQKLLNQPSGTLSLGQRMKADIAAALLHQPSLLFLDEPTIGLDVTAKASLRDHLNRMAKELETTILLTSHDTDDIEQICQRVILIDHGHKLLDTSLIELKRDYARFKTLRLITEEETPSFDHDGVTILHSDEHQIDLSIDTQIIETEKVVATCLNRFKIRDIAIESMPLEEVIKKLYASNKGAA